MTDALGKEDGRGSTRREFTRAVALAAAAPLVAGAADPPPAEPATGLAQALTQVVRGRHGKHLTDEQLAAVQRGIAGGLASADRLRRVRLDNRDEPAFAFTADVR